MSNREIKKIMNGALLLTAASFIAKLLSAAYRVPFQNLVGNTGFYAYQQIYPLYGLGMTLALNGLPVFFSKVIAESSSLSVQKKTAGRLSGLLGIIAVLLFLLLYFGANPIGEQTGDKKLQPIIKMVSWQFLFIPFLAVSRGFFQGRFQMTPTAVSQVVEQVVRVAVILSVAYLYSTGVGTVYEMASSAMSSAWIAAVAASIVMLLFLFLSSKKEEVVVNEEDVIPSYKFLLKRLGTEGLTICLLSAVLILFQLIDSFTLYKGLIESGVEAVAAKNLKGVYDRGQPLVQLGMVVATALSSSLLPVLTKNIVEKKRQAFYRNAISFLRITAVVSAAATTGIILLLPYLNHTLFGDKQGIATLSVYLGAVFLAAMIGSVNAILQSQSKHHQAFLGLVYGLVAKIGTNSLLISWFGIIGSSMGTILGLATSLLYVWYHLDQPIRNAWKEKQFGIKLLVSCIVMGAGVWITTAFLTTIGLSENRFGSLIVSLVGVGIGMGLFLKWIVYTKLMTIREWLSLPLGKQLLGKRG